MKRIVLLDARSFAKTVTIFENWRKNSLTKNENRYRWSNDFICTSKCTAYIVPTGTSHRIYIHTWQSRNTEITLSLFLWSLVWLLMDFHHMQYHSRYIRITEMNIEHPHPKHRLHVNAKAQYEILFFVFHQEIGRNWFRWNCTIIFENFIIFSLQFQLRKWIGIPKF